MSDECSRKLQRVPRRGGDRARPVLQVPVVGTPEDVQRAVRDVCETVHPAKRATSTLDLIVLPEYSVHALSMSTATELMCDVDGPEANAFAEVWEPGDLGVPVRDGPAGSRLGLVICRDGMLPEMARETAYRGANVILRTAGCAAPIRHEWRVTNQANALCNLAYTASVCLAGSDATYRSDAKAHDLGFDGVPLVESSDIPGEIVYGEVLPGEPTRPESSGAWTTTPTSSATAAAWPFEAAPGTAPARGTTPARTCATSSRASTASRGRTGARSPTGRPTASPSAGGRRDVVAVAPRGNGAAEAGQAC